jgi:hypothetical protein
MPHLSEILKTELAAFRERIGENTLDIIETGTIRNTGEAYRVNDGWSTLTFAEDIAEHGGSYVGVDLNTDAAKEVLGERLVELDIELITGHSIDVLSDMLAHTADLGRFDVAFLDSDNDAGLILHEYLVVSRLMNSPGLIMVDDVDPRSSGVVKGHQLMPWLDAHGTPYRLEIRHGDGYETGVLVIEV